MLPGHDSKRITAARVLLVALCLLPFTSIPVRAQVAQVAPLAPAAPPAPGYDYNAPAPASGSSVFSVPADPPNSVSKMPMPQEPEPPAGPMRVLQAICWYIPNRILDLIDIPRLHIAFGDGQGVSVRATKFLTATWFEDNAYCLGWTRRTPPWFSEEIQEHYFGFFAAQGGDLDRDPTELGLSLHLLVVGANAALSLGEAVDCLAGLAGIDLSGDDHGPMLVEDKTRPDPDQIRLQQEIYPDRPVSPAAPAQSPPGP